MAKYDSIAAFISDGIMADKNITAFILNSEALFYTGSQSHEQNSGNETIADQTG